MRKYAIIVALFLLAGTTGAASRVAAAPALSAGGVPAEHIAPEDPCAQSSTGCLGGRNSCPSNVQVLMTFGHNRPINLGVDTAANCHAAGYCEAAVPAFTGTPAPMVAQFACREDDEACMNRLGAGLKQTP